MDSIPSHFILLPSDYTPHPFVYPFLSDESRPPVCRAVAALIELLVDDATSIEAFNSLFHKAKLYVITNNLSFTECCFISDTNPSEEISEELYNFCPDAIEDVELEINSVIDGDVVGIPQTSDLENSDLPEDLDISDSPEYMVDLKGSSPDDDVWFLTVNEDGGGVPNPQNVSFDFRDPILRSGVNLMNEEQRVNFDCPGSSMLGLPDVIPTIGSTRMASSPDFNPLPELEPPENTATKVGVAGETISSSHVVSPENGFHLLEPETPVNGEHSSSLNPSSPGLPDLLPENKLSVLEPETPVNGEHSSSFNPRFEAEFPQEINDEFVNLSPTLLVDVTTELNCLNPHIVDNYCGVLEPLKIDAPAILDCSFIGDVLSPKINDGLLSMASMDIDFDHVGNGFDEFLDESVCSDLGSPTIDVTDAILSLDRSHLGTLDAVADGLALDLVNATKAAVEPRKAMGVQDFWQNEFSETFDVGRGSLFLNEWSGGILSAGAPVSPDLPESVLGANEGDSVPQGFLAVDPTAREKTLLGNDDYVNCKLAENPLFEAYSSEDAGWVFVLTNPLFDSMPPVLGDDYGYNDSGAVISTDLVCGFACVLEPVMAVIDSVWDQHDLRHTDRSKLAVGSVSFTPTLEHKPPNVQSNVQFLEAGFTYLVGALVQVGGSATRVAVWKEKPPDEGGNRLLWRGKQATQLQLGLLIGI